MAGELAAESMLSPNLSPGVCRARIRCLDVDSYNDIFRAACATERSFAIIL